MLELPHTKGCLVCGRDNPHGMYLKSLVDPDTGAVQADFTPQPHHIGFENIIHGGVLATLLDEIMVWSAIWASGKACVAAEMSLRFIKKAAIGQPLKAIAMVTRNRSRLIETSSEIFAGSELICIGSGKYIPLGPIETAEFLRTFVEEETTRGSAALLRAR